MKRNCGLEDISDGKLYELNDLVEASCNGCRGKASCCHGMGNSIILDPLDIYRITTNLNCTFEELLQSKIELNVVDGIILPNLKMTGPDDACAFLGSTGKCSIHSSRPGICRIFPLGRYYENHGFKYFLQVNECGNSSKSLTKVSKWIDTPGPKDYERYLIEWHYFLNAAEDKIKSRSDENFIKNLNLYLLHTFYIKKYDTNQDFYSQFQDRLAEARMILN